MDNENKNFKGQQKNEEIACFCRKHWVVLLPTFIGAGLFLVILVIVTANLNYKVISFFREQEVILRGSLILMLALSTFYIHRFFIKLINYFFDMVVITNYRVVTLKKTLFIQHDRDAIDLSKIQDVIKQQEGLIKNILKYGEIIITLSGASTTKILKYMPNPDYIFRKIYELKRDYIIGREVEKRELTEEKINNNEDIKDSQAQPTSFNKFE